MLTRLTTQALSDFTNSCRYAILEDSLKDKFSGLTSLV